MYSNKYGIITGRWSKKTYTPVKRIGIGGIGEIYLVKDTSESSFALKISKDLVSITKEYRNLKKFGDKCFVPKVYELDDYERGDTVYHFFTMEYIEGCTLKEALRSGKLSMKCKLDIMRVLANTLKQINSEGYAYTDLKHENIMIDKRKGLVRLIDLGSMVKLGDTVKEYTPMYDRKSWNMGGRVADLSYQMFAFMIFFITMLLGRDIEPGKDKLEAVMKKLKKMGMPEELHHMLNRYMKGSITNFSMLYDELGDICLCRTDDGRLNTALNVVIAFLSILLAVLIGTIFV